MSRPADSADLGTPLMLAASVSGSRVVLTWVATAGDTSDGSYVIEAGSTPGAANLGQFAAFSGQNFPGQTYSIGFDNVPDGVYYVRVRFRNSTGVLSSASNEIVANVSACSTVPNPPIGLQASVNGTLVSLTWTAPASACATASYVIEAGSASGLSNLATVNTGNSSTSFTASGVASGAYFVRVRAVNRVGQSAPSNEVTFIVAATGCLYTYTLVADEIGRGWRLSAAGGTRLVTVSTNLSTCPWRVSQDSLPPWMQVTPLAGSGSNQVTIQIAPNTTGADRTGGFSFSPTANNQCSPFCGIESRVSVNQSF